VRAPIGLLVCLVTVSAAAAPPTDEALAAHATALVRRLDGQGFTVLVEPPFVLVGDEAPAKLRQRAQTVRWTRELLRRDFFGADPDRVLEVWLFKDERSYRRGAKHYFGDEPNTPYGYYSSDHDALVMNIGPGAGTLVHEVVHPYVEANFPDAPSWFNEGLASLYERPTEKKGHIWGLPNWRLPNLKKQITDRTLPGMAKLLGTSRDEFYNAEFDAYAYARYLLLYLQEQGKLTAFYQKFVADKTDPTGRAALEDVLGEKLETFEPRWRKWAVALKGDNH